jgi:hypothetical protein
MTPFSRPTSQAFNRRLGSTTFGKARCEALCYQWGIRPDIVVLCRRDVDFLVGHCGLETSSSPPYPADEDVAIVT